MAKFTASGRSPQTEAMLTAREFSWEYRQGVALAVFDEDKSLHNQARVGKPIDPATVDRYVTSMGNGDIFPALISAEQPKSKLLIVDGNHRFGAYKRRGIPVIDTYVVTGATPQQIMLLTFEVNTKHGLPSTEADRVHQALYLMDSGISAEEASRRLGVKVSALRSAANLAAVDRRADDAGLIRTRWDKLPMSARLRLGQIGDDDGFAAMANLAIEAGLSTPDISGAVSEMAKLRTSRKQVEYVHSLRGVFADKLRGGGVKDNPGVGRQIRSPRMILGMALGQMTALPTPESIVERMTPDDKLDYLGRVEQAMARLNAIKDALKK